RWVLVAATLSAAAAAGAAYSNAFWPMVLLGLLGLCIAFTAATVLDLGWRVRTAITGALCTLGFLVLWPTLSNASGGKLPVPAYVRDNVEFRLVAGLDLRGGLRLVYTVDVDEAIKDKRDSYYESMRRELAKVYGLLEGDERPSEEVLEKLREKVEVVAPRQNVNAVTVSVKPGADPSKID